MGRASEMERTVRGFKERRACCEDCAVREHVSGLTFVAVGKFPVVDQTRLYGLWGYYTFLFRKRGSEKAVHHPTFAFPWNLLRSSKQYYSRPSGKPHKIYQTYDHLFLLLPI